MVRRRMLTVAAGVLVLGGMSAPFAVAAPPPATFDDLGACNQAGIETVNLSGGPGALSYFCERTTSAPAGQGGCPTTAQDGCIGEYWILRTVPR